MEMNTGNGEHEERVARMRREFEARFAPKAEPELEAESFERDELRGIVNELVDNRICELLGESRRVPIGLLSRRSGVSSDALRMRCCRLGIKTAREGRIVTIAIGDVERLLGNTTRD
jgi:hypothetical protein